jgi:hypothetical protein
MNISLNAGSFSPTQVLPVAQRNFSTNGTIGFVELQDIWQKNVMKIVRQCHNVSNIRAPKYLSSKSTNLQLSISSAIFTVQNVACQDKRICSWIGPGEQ